MNTSPQAIAFSNNVARVMADQFGSLYLSAKKLLANWQAQGIAAVIPNDATAIDDGASADGRPIATDAAVNALVSLCQQYVSWVETGQAAAGAAANDAVLGQVAALSVNTRTYF